MKPKLQRIILSCTGAKRTPLEGRCFFNNKEMITRGDLQRNSHPFQHQGENTSLDPSRFLVSEDKCFNSRCLFLHYPKKVPLHVNLLQTWSPNLEMRIVTTNNQMLLWRFVKPGTGRGIGNSLFLFSEIFISLDFGYGLDFW